MNPDTECTVICPPGGDAAEHSVKVVAAQGKEDPRGRGPELRGVLVAVTVRVDKMADFREELLHQHGLIQTQAVLGLLETKEKGYWSKVAIFKKNPVDVGS